MSNNSKVAPEMNSQSFEPNSPDDGEEENFRWRDLIQYDCTCGIIRYIIQYFLDTAKLPFSFSVCNPLILSNCLILKILIKIEFFILP